MKHLDLGVVPTLGALLDRMLAVAIRKER